MLEIKILIHGVSFFVFLPFCMNSTISVTKKTSASILIAIL